MSKHHEYRYQITTFGVILQTVGECQARDNVEYLFCSRSYPSGDYASLRVANEPPVHQLPISARSQLDSGREDHVEIPEVTGRVFFHQLRVKLIGDIVVIYRGIF